MLRLNKTQKEIEELAGRVPQITNEQKEWARNHFNYFQLIRQADTEVVCLDCKSRIPIGDNKRYGSKWCSTDWTIRCPHCGATIQVRRMDGVTRHKNYHQEDFFQIMNVVGGWQVTRLIYMERYCYVRKENSPWEYHEVCQAWNHPEFKTTFFRAFPKGMTMNRPFNPYKLRDWTPKRDNEGNYIMDEKGWYICDYKPCVLEPRKAGGANYFDCRAIVPGGKILPYYKQMGLNARSIVSSKHNAMWLFECFSKPYYKPMYETLFKWRDWDSFDRLTEKRNRDTADAYFTALKICKRNGYDYKKMGREWLDLVQMCIDLGLDYHSPHYVCPKDFDDMHRRLVRMKHKKEDEAKLRKEMQKNADYKKRIQRYLDMDIHGNGLVVFVLPSIQAFKEEGDHLGHCVYSCHYYDHKDSLILSARDESGKRWETIEVSLTDFKILQCYGYGDKFTERHSEIKKLVMKNMWQIRERRLAS